MQMQEEYEPDSQGASLVAWLSCLFHLSGYPECLHLFLWLG